MNERRRQKCETLCPDALKHYDRIAGCAATPIYPGRSGGDSLCVVCKNKLYDHPRHPHASDNTIITCSGLFLKL